MTRRRIAVAAVTALAAVAATAALVVVRHGDDPGVDTAFVLLSLWLGLALGAVGAFLLALRPTNRIGPVLAVAGVALSLEFSLRAYAYVGLVADPGSVPAAATAGWLGLALDPLFFPASLVLTFSLFPDGHLPSRRWRPVVAIVGVALGVQVAALALRTGPLLDESYGYEIAWRGLAGGVMSAQTAADLAGLGTLAVLALVPVVAVKLGLQLRRARGLERQQFRPLLLVVSLIVVGLLLQLADPTRGLGVAVLVGSVTIGLPAALAVAALRYRLWDVDRVIIATIVYGALAALATAVYVTVVVALSRLGGPEPGSEDVGPAVVATLVVALAFAPLRDRLTRAARRLVYGVRATPYEALAALPHRLADAPAIDDVLPQTAAVLAGGLGVPAARVRALLPDGSTQAAWFPRPPDEQADTDPSRVLVEPIRHLGETVGDLTVVASVDRPLGAAERRLLVDLAAQAGPAVRGVALTARLRAQLEQITAQAGELRASRERLAVAQVAERRRIERDIHDGAQYQLVSLSMQLKELEGVVAGRDTDAVPLLTECQTALQSCIDELRELARGIYPPVLAARGLAAGLRARARSMAGEVRVVAAPEVENARFDAAVELAVYFCCSEALQNAAKHAADAEVVVRLSATPEQLEAEVVDDGPGFASHDDSAHDVAERAGLADRSDLGGSASRAGSAAAGTGLLGMRDRLAAVGGEVFVDSAPGRGTTIRARVPLHGPATAPPGAATHSAE